MDTQIYNSNKAVNALGLNSVTSYPSKLSINNNILDVRIFNRDGLNAYVNYGGKLNNTLLDAFSNPKLLFKLSEFYTEMLANPRLKREFLEAVRLTAAHEAAHASKFGNIGDINLNSTYRRIAEHNKLFPVRKANDNISNYFIVPDELRVRALMLERLKLTTGRSYKDLLNDPEIINSNRNIYELKNNYNQDDLLNYLDHFAYNNSNIDSNINLDSYA